MTTQEQLEAILKDFLNDTANGYPAQPIAIKAITALIQEAVNEGGAAKFIEQGWGKRCKTSDLEDFPHEDFSKGGRCPCCEMWEHYDEWLARPNQLSGGSNNES